MTISQTISQTTGSPVRRISDLVRRLPNRLTCDARRTIARFFWVGDERAHKILARVRSLSDAEVSGLLREVVSEFEANHPGLAEIMAEHYREAIGRLGVAASDDPARQRLIGAYFTMEYAHEAAALFNPSMIQARDQRGLPEGSTRFVMSLRAVGEGHVSSIVFRRGVIDRDCQVSFDPLNTTTLRLRRVENRTYDKADFREHLKEAGFYSEAVEQILARLGEEFMCPELVKAVEAQEQMCEAKAVFREMADRVIWLARSNYQIELPHRDDLTEAVIFPISELESGGMEDMRLVSFTEPDGGICVYGTYTAYDGSRIVPQIMVSKDPYRMEVYALHGVFARNKGLAMFPRRVDGQYMMIGRCDAENLYLLRSNSVLNWNEGHILQTPKYPWEFVQIGNCGSPIETQAGWLVLTHGVGPMRRYCMGAMLLDLNDPSKVIGHLPEPFLLPMKDERVGYVPNVVYSCGAMVHGEMLVVPYGISDAATGFAVVPLRTLLDAVRKPFAGSPHT